MQITELVVAIRRKRLGRKLITLGNGHQYSFATKRNLNITMIPESDVETVLAIKEACCGGPKKPGYVRATDQEIAKWERK